MPRDPTNNNELNSFITAISVKVGTRRREILLKPFSFYTTQDRIFLVAVKKPSRVTVEEVTQFTTTFATSSTTPSPTSAEKKRTSVTTSTVLTNVLSSMEKKLDKSNVFVATSLLNSNTMKVIFRSVLVPTFRTDGFVSGPPKVARNTSL